MYIFNHLEAHFKYFMRVLITFWTHTYKPCSRLHGVYICGFLSQEFICKWESCVAKEALALRK